jgi:hypothetical protein
MPSLRRKRYALLFALAVLAGAGAACSTDEGIDVSREPEFAAMIGREYRIVGDVDAYGIKNEDRDSSAAYVTLIPPPGISGPEVAFTKRLPKGLTVRIAAAKHRFRAFTNGTDYVVELNGSDLPPGLEVRIALFRGNQSGDTDLNPRLYQRIDN